jgi:hypothetical protein
MSTMLALVALVLALCGGGGRNADALRRDAIAL